MMNMTDWMNKLFSPDIKIKVRGEKSIITACEPASYLGAKYLVTHAILDKSYDEIQDADGICFEIVDDELFDEIFFIETENDPSSDE